MIGTLLASCAQNGTGVPDPTPTLAGLGGFGADINSLIGNLKGIAFEVIGAAIVVVIILLVLGHATHNHEVAKGSRVGVVVVVLAGFLLGALPTLANAAFGIGSTGGC